MHICCPHCKNSIEVIEEQQSLELICPSCGSDFQLNLGSTAIYQGQERKLGRFVIVDQVGVGAFGTVYMARDPQLDRVVALKVPRSGNLATQEELDRFLREARSAAQLRHPGIVPIHEVGYEEGVPYLVSEFVRGTTLADLLSARRPTFRESSDLIAAIADALEAAHQQGVVHRDVKPSKIMLQEGASLGSGSSELGSLGSSTKPTVSNWTPRLMDFGLAKREAGEITMTVDGQVLGTPAYMSPEQASGSAHNVDGRSDVYSLGVILYELLTGELPFRGTKRMLIYQVVHDEPRPPRRLNDRIPRDLETICLKGMAKEPGRRYESAAFLAADLRRWLKGESIKARPVSSAERFWRWCRRKPTVAALIALMCLLAVGGPILGLQQARLRVAESEQREQAERNGYNAQLGRVAGLAEMSPETAVKLLNNDDLVPKRFRDFTWRALHHRLAEMSKTLAAHKDLVHSLEFSPDSKQLASIDLTGTLLLWEVESGRRVKTLFQSPAKARWLDVLHEESMEVFGRLFGTYSPRSTIRYSADGRFLVVHWAPFGKDFDDQRPSEVRVFNLEEGLSQEFPRIEQYTLSPSVPLVALVSGESVGHVPQRGS